MHLRPVSRDAVAGLITSSRCCLSCARGAEAPPKARRYRAARCNAVRKSQTRHRRRCREISAERRRRPHPCLEVMLQSRQRRAPRFGYT